MRCLRSWWITQTHTHYACVQEWHLRLTYMTYEALGVMRISEMFEIVVDYPDSHPAVSA